MIRFTLVHEVFACQYAYTSEKASAYRRDDKFLELLLRSIAAKCLRALSGLFSPNLIGQSACKMDLALACVVLILRDDWSIWSGENRLDRVLKHLAAMLF